jgi:hypothetical protein
MAISRTWQLPCACPRAATVCPNSMQPAPEFLPQLCWMPALSRQHQTPENVAVEGGKCGVGSQAKRGLSHSRLLRTHVALCCRPCWGRSFSRCWACCSSRPGCGLASRWTKLAPPCATPPSSSALSYSLVYASISGVQWYVCLCVLYTASLQGVKRLCM